MGSTKAMLKQLAPMARMPPSPKNTAWMMRAMLTARQADQGPNRIAMSVPQTAWPVVPPGSGILNIMERKQNAAAIPMSGIFSRGTVSRTFLTAAAQMGTIATSRTAQVEGLR